MQRLRLYTSGVKVPKLGSYKDSVLRQFMLMESKKNINLNQIQAYIAMAAGDSKQWQANIKKIWSSYIALELGMEVEDEEKATLNSEKEMMSQYEAVRKLRPKLIVDRKNGKLIVTGLQ